MYTNSSKVYLQSRWTNVCIFLRVFSGPQNEILTSLLHESNSNVKQYHDLYVSKPNDQINRKGQISTPQLRNRLTDFDETEPSSYLLKTTHHAKFHFDPTTWVVSANTQFAAVWFLSLSFSLSFLVSSSRAQVAPVDRLWRPIRHNMTCFSAY